MENTPAAAGNKGGDMRERERENSCKDVYGSEYSA